MDATLRSVQEINQDIPFAPRTIERPALLEKFNQVKQTKITLVSAPPGYGKSTTVASFARSSGLPCAWHTIEETERDLPALYTHTLQALEYVAPGISDTDWMPEYSSSEHATYITSYLRRYVSDQFLYVLDDLQLIANSPAAESWLQSLVTTLPANCHLILISRTLPNIPLAEFIADGDVLAIGQEDLQFTQDEAEHLANAFKNQASVQLIRKRIETLDGWPAGIMLSLQPLPQALENSFLSGRAGPEAVFEALADATLRRQTPVMQEFLLSSSVLNRLTPELCIKAIKLTNSKQMLDSILQRNLFIAQASGGMVYHRLFRNFLRTRLHELFPERYAELNTLAGEWYESRRNFDEAFNHFIEANDLDAALRIANRVHRAYFSRGQFESLLHWRSLLGENAVKAPYLIYTCAMVHIDRSDFAKAQQELELADDAFSRTSDASGLAEVSTQRAMVMLRQGYYPNVIDLMTELRGQKYLEEKLRGRIQHLLGLGYLGLGEIDEAIHHLESIIEVYERTHDAYDLSVALQDLEVAYTRAGRLDDASQCLQQVVALRRRLGRSDALALALNNLGYHYHQRGDYKRAMSSLEEGIKVIARDADRRTESYLLWSMADLKRDLAQFDEAVELYNRAYELSQGSEASLQRSIMQGMATLYIWQGNYNVAEYLMRDATRISNLPSEALDQFVNDALLYAAHPDDTTAFKHLRHIYDRLYQHNAQSEYVRVAALYIGMAFEQGNLDAVEMCLDDLLAIAPDFKGVQPLIAEVSFRERLYEHLAERKKYERLTEQVDELIECRSDMPAPTSDDYRISVQLPTYSLRVFTLGQDRIERDGVVIEVAEWRSSRAKEFFLYLLFEKANRREDISLTFWPDSDSAKVRSNFHTTLYRARQALGEEAIVFDGERYRINPAIDVSCDALDMMQLVREARLLPEIDARTEDLWLRALSLYQGELLSQFDTEWIAPHRTRVQEGYLEALIGAARCAYVRRAYKEAVEIIDQALIVDPFREAAYRVLLQCYGQLGEYRQMYTRYQDMESLFKTELGISPSPETTALYKRLLLP